MCVVLCVDRHIFVSLGFLCVFVVNDSSVAGSRPCMLMSVPQRIISCEDNWPARAQRDGCLIAVHRLPGIASGFSFM